jgi:hypothetical protein
VRIFLGPNFGKITFLNGLSAADKGLAMTIRRVAIK